MQGSDAIVAVVTDGRRAEAYLCDGQPGDRGGVIGERFRGVVAANRIRLVSDGGVRLTATLSEQAAE